MRVVFVICLSFDRSLDFHSRHFGTLRQRADENSHIPAMEKLEYPEVNAAAFRPKFVDAVAEIVRFRSV